MWHYTGDGCAYWVPSRLLVLSFDPIHAATRLGGDGRVERGVANTLVKKGVISQTGEKRIYRFTELGVKWLMWYRHTEHGYPLPTGYDQMANQAR